MSISEDGMQVLSGMDVRFGKDKHDFAVVIKARLNHEITEEEKDAVQKVQQILKDAFTKGANFRDSEVHTHAARQRSELIGCFGHKALYVDDIPNGYCSRGCCAYYPWFIVTTPVGRIKIGWRKRVIHLEWTDSQIEGKAEDIFPHEEAWPGYETTQYDKVIHAHSVDAATRYIGRLMEAGLRVE